jgi:hypothetical protein
MLRVVDVDHDKHPTDSGADAWHVEYECDDLFYGIQLFYLYYRIPIVSNHYEPYENVGVIGLSRASLVTTRDPTNTRLLSMLHDTRYDRYKNAKNS